MAKEVRYVVMITSSTVESINNRLVERHALYAKSLNEGLGERYKLVMITSSAELPGAVLRVHDDFLVVSSGVKKASGIPKSSLKTLVKSFGDSWLLIASDPFVALRSAIRFRILAKRNIPIETQFHGDFGNPSWTRSSSKAFLGSWLARMQIEKSDFFRLVSKTQMSNIVAMFNINPERAYVAPVPIDPVNIPGNAILKMRSVLFVGRLHSERGLALWAEVALWLHKKDSTISFIICGSGPGEQKFRKLLEPILGKKVCFLGHLSTPQLSAEMLKGGVLLSTPPFESLGRSLIEAHALGLVSVTTPTSGAIDLSQRFSSIKLSGLLPDELGQDALKILNAPPEVVDLKKRLLDIDDFNKKAVQTLTYNWKKEIENSRI